MSDNRRRFLRYLAASPLLAARAQEPGLIATPDDAINVMDFEPVAQKKLPPAHWGYMASGVEGDETLHANRAGFNNYFLRPRRLIYTKEADLRTNVLGTPWDCPIALAPVGSIGAFHPQAELAVARAAKQAGFTQFLSTYTNTPITKVCDALGRPVWFQLYAHTNWSANEYMVRAAEAAGAPAITFTVDVQAGRRSETFERLRKLDKRECQSCHGKPLSADAFRRKYMFAGMDPSWVSPQDRTIGWHTLDKLRKLTSRKLIVKGIETAEDARLCLEHGADAIIVSNHGGRATETGRGSIEALEEVASAVGNRATLLVDGGFRRGTDVFKALALGARAVLVGRPYLWGLSAFGEPGVLKVLSLLRAELELIMRQCGATSIAEIGPQFIGRRSTGR